MSQLARKLFRRATLVPPVTRLLDQWQQRNQTMTLGQRGEREAERFLLRQGWIVLARSYRDPIGEIDLVAVDQRTVVFVEVKTRRDELGGQPEEAVDLDKQQRLTRVAKSYLHRHSLTEQSIRFDVVSILWPPDQPIEQITHYPSAFEAQDAGQLY